MTLPVPVNTTGYEARLSMLNINMKVVFDLQGVSLKAIEVSAIRSLPR